MDQPQRAGPGFEAPLADCVCVCVAVGSSLCCCVICMCRGEGLFCTGGFVLNITSKEMRLPVFPPHLCSEGSFYLLLLHDARLTASLYPLKDLTVSP